MVVDPDGNVLATVRLDGEGALAPNGHLSLFIDQIPWSAQIDFSDFMGVIRVRPSAKIAATVVQNPAWPVCHDAGGGPVARA